MAAHHLPSLRQAELNSRGVQATPGFQERASDLLARQKSSTGESSPNNLK